MYITKANFKRIIREIDVPQDYKFEDLILWKAPDGKEYKGDWKSKGIHCAMTYCKPDLYGECPNNNRCAI